MSPAAPSRLAARWIGWSPIRVWGLAPADRLVRSLARTGLADCAPWDGDAPPGTDRVLLALGDHVYDDALISALAKAPDTVVLAVGRPVAAIVARPAAASVANALAGEAALPPDIRLATPDELVSVHRPKLRKREGSFALPVNAASRKQVERRLFGASYKGVTDFVTKYVWPAPARFVTGLCAAAGITPNMVTLAGLALTVAAFFLMWSGWLGWGLACAWAMTFLDTVDGKLARVTLASSKFGDALDHGLDLVHPPFWYWAWHVGSGNTDATALWITVIGYLLLRGQEGLFLWRFGIEMHVWQRFDSRFRLVTSRRNPNLVLLTAALIAGRPEWGIPLVAAWTLASLAIHSWRILAAARRYPEGGKVKSWLE